MKTLNRNFRFLEVVAATLLILDGPRALAYMGENDMCQREQAAAEMACTSADMHPGWQDPEASGAEQNDTKLTALNVATPLIGAVTAAQSNNQQQRSLASAQNARNKAQQCRNAYRRCMSSCNTEKSLYGIERDLAAILPAMGEVAKKKSSPASRREEGTKKCEKFEQKAQQADQQAAADQQSAQTNNQITQNQTGTPATGGAATPGATQPASPTNGAPTAAQPSASAGAQPSAPSTAPVASPVTSPVTAPIASQPVSQPATQPNCVHDGDKTYCPGENPASAKIPPTHRGGQIQLTEYDEHGLVKTEYRSSGLEEHGTQNVITAFPRATVEAAGGGRSYGAGAYDGEPEASAPEGFFTDEAYEKMELARGSAGRGGGGGQAGRGGGGRGAGFGRGPASETAGGSRARVGGQSNPLAADGVTGPLGPTLFEKISSQYSKQSSSMVGD